MIIAIHRIALKALYGANAWQTLEPVVKRYIDKLNSKGIPPGLLYLDDPKASDLPNADPAESGDASAAAELIRAKALRMQVLPAAVLLVGGHEAIPMHELPNPPNEHPSDKDTHILTDNPYGCLTAVRNRYVFPDLAVGRIAAGSGDGIKDIVDQLERAIRLREQATTLAGSFILSNLEWLGASRLVATQIAQTQGIKTAPYYRLETGNVGDLRRSVHFINLHGQASGPGWFGGTQKDPRPAVDPEIAAASEMMGSVIFACNCYGAQIKGRSTSQSIALTLLRRGCAGFAGSTCYAFGALPPKTMDFSEDLAFRFFQAFQNKMPAGLALHLARRAYVRARTTGGRMNNSDIKTALQFVFFGDTLL